jgi:hypothetical protein
MIEAMSAEPAIEEKEQALLARHVAEKLSLRAMVDSVLAAYQDALDRRERVRAPAVEVAL